MNESIVNALRIMGYGMGGIFVAAAIIMLAVWIMQKMDGIGKKKTEK